MATMSKPITSKQLENATRMAAKVVEVFGDDWHLHYDSDGDEVSCRNDDEGPIEGSYVEVFSTSQWPSDSDHSPVAEFLCASIVMVPRLVGEAQRLKARLEAAEYTMRKALAEVEHEEVVYLLHGYFAAAEAAQAEQGGGAP